MSGSKSLFIITLCFGGRGHITTATVELTPERFGSKAETLCFGSALAKLVPGLFKLLPFKDESKILEPLTPEQA